jgi:SAM-dependent methyltransferase
MFSRSLAAALLGRVPRKTKDRLRAARDRSYSLFRYDAEQWIRVVQRKAWKEFLASESRSPLRMLEVSPDAQSLWRPYASRSYESVQFPDFDIARDRLPRTFDVILAEQVFEHIRDADAAAENVRKMLQPDGVFLIGVPFLVKLHGPPAYGDFRRWSRQGLEAFLQQHGFSRVESHAWGNAKAVVANLRRWKAFGWGRDLSNDPELPVVVWAYARP